MIAASLTITALAFLIDGALALVQRAVTPRPLRQLGRNRGADEIVEPSWDIAEALSLHLRDKPRGGMTHVRYTTKVVARASTADARAGRC